MSNGYIPLVIHDSERDCYYRLIRFFGQGRYGKCYDVWNVNSCHYACKVVSKTLIVTSHQKARMTREIDIHKSLQHKHVVGFHTSFEDPHNYYIVLERCNNGPLSRMYRRRLVFTEPETRFYMRQLLLGVRYLHSVHVIHKDLKFDNLLLDDDLNLKIGDFGFAVRNESKGLININSGTLNYKAPEIMSEAGHSFNVDIWSLGCIMYAMLVGKTPFHADTVEDTNNKIKRCDYSIPSSVDKLAASMIALQLQLDPAKRPAARKLLSHEFFMSGIMPVTLPASCLYYAPDPERLLNMAPSLRLLDDLNSTVEHIMAVDPVGKQAPPALPLPLAQQKRSRLATTGPRPHRAASAPAPRQDAPSRAGVGRPVGRERRRRLQRQLRDLVAHQRVQPALHKPAGPKAVDDQASKTVPPGAE